MNTKQKIKMKKPEPLESVRSRVAAHAKRQREAGLQKVCVWVPVDRADELKAFAAKLKASVTVTSD